VQDLDREVFALLTEDVLDFLANDLACAVVGINNAVSDLELDVCKRLDGFEILQVLFR
jgi:hypothetical protein